MDNDKVKAIAEGFCEHHSDFEKKLNQIIDAQEDKMMDIWKMTKTELYEITMTSQKVVLEHISGLKDMVTNFLNITARNTERHEKEIANIHKRVLKLETRYHEMNGIIKQKKEPDEYNK
jgi:hypothetical protein